MAVTLPGDRSRNVPASVKAVNAIRQTAFIGAGKRCPPALEHPRRSRILPGLGGYPGKTPFSSYIKNNLRTLRYRAPQLQNRSFPHELAGLQWTLLLVE